MNPKKINDLMKQAFDALPDGAKKLPQDMKENIQAAMSATLSKLNLVTREEFDAQVKVLQKTREKLEALEAELNQGSDKE